MPPDYCPCGTQPKAGLETIQYINQTIIDGLVSANGLKVLPLMDPLFARAFNIDTLCATVPLKPAGAVASWWENPIAAGKSILEAVLQIEWDNWCECAPCPPIAGCSGANSYFVAPSDGWLADPGAGQYRFRSGGGQDAYVQRVSNGHCYGPFSGVYITWNTNATFDPNQGVQICSYDGSSCTGYNANPPGDDFTLQVFVGAGDGTGPKWPWDQNGVTVADPPQPPACDPADVCAALDYVYRALNALRTGQDDSYPLTGNIGETTSFMLPGIENPISGSISNQLAEIARALAPISPGQLTNATTTPVSSSGVVPVSGQVMAVIEFVTVPPWVGSRGIEAPIYYSGASYPGPGWLLVVGDYGVIQYQTLIYPQGVQLMLPPTATALVLELNAGVEVTVTVYDRDVS